MNRILLDFIFVDMDINIEYLWIWKKCKYHLSTYGYEYCFVFSKTDMETYPYLYTSIYNLSRYGYEYLVYIFFKTWIIICICIFRK